MRCARSWIIAPEARTRSVPAGTLVIHEGGKTGHLFVLIEGRLEVVKGDTVVAVHHRARRGARRNVGAARPAAHRDRARSVGFRRSTSSTMPPSFLRDQPAVALLIARLLAQRLNVATTYLADLKQQYAGHGNHLSMVGELLQSMINLPPIGGLARIGSAI